ncbi:nuclear transport factor 2 family protein [Novosphingobium sp. TH158]|uniref:nuclear transport factor 2 family protein n=1 Tax=Novosphingobium sp. TH158 TaxID=2067455 RepID=UPI0013045ED2|nr:nuclear transport factor 2 family protein [Novosphingobium sp. TH158]
MCEARPAHTSGCDRQPACADLADDTAVVWSYGIAHHMVGKDEGCDEIIAGVQYRDKCRRTDDGWLIIERSIANQWVDMRKPA